MDTYPIAASSLERYYYVDGHLLERQYRDYLSGYFDWKERPHAGEWLVFPENVGPNMSIDETSLSDGELYTVLTNKDAHGRKGTLAAIVAGTKAEVVREALDHIVNGNQKCSDFGNNECSIFGIKTTVLLASAVQ